MKPRRILTLLQLALEPEAQNNEVLPLWVRNLSSKLDDSVFKELFPLLMLTQTIRSLQVLLSVRGLTNICAISV